MREIEAELRVHDRVERIAGTGNGPIDAFVHALKARFDVDFKIFRSDSCNGSCNLLICVISRENCSSVSAPNRFGGVHDRVARQLWWRRGWRIV